VSQNNISHITFK